MSGGSVYPSPESFHLSRRIYVGMTSLVEVPRTGSFRSVPEVICALSGRHAWFVGHREG